MTPNAVVVTRPLAQAEPLALGITALGRQAIVFPLLEIHPLEDQTLLRAALRELSAYAMVAFVSPNAVDATFSVLHGLALRWPREVALAVMGEGSRQALVKHGVTQDNATIISPRDSTRTDSHTLLQALDLPGLAGKRVLIMRGESGRELLADALREAGVKVRQVAAYRRAAPILDDAGQARLRQLIEISPDWLVTSSESVRILMQLAQQIAGAAGVAKLQQQKIIVPHARIAETAQMLGFKDIVLTGSGDEQVLAALQFAA